MLMNLGQEMFIIYPFYFFHGKDTLETNGSFRDVSVSLNFKLDYPGHKENYVYFFICFSKVARHLSQ